MDNLEQSIAASIVIQNTNNVWVNDNMVARCLSCNKKFTMYYRKHHCRNCGNIFCYDCSNYFISIPDFLKDKLANKVTWNDVVSKATLTGKMEESRVCEKCFTDIRAKKSVHDKIEHVLINLPDIIEMNQNQDPTIQSFYYEKFRNIQYYLPNHEYTEQDRKFLRVNSKHFAGHSKYIVHLIKSINWKNVPSHIVFQTSNGTANGIHDDVMMVVDIINGEKSTRCQDLLCTRTCDHTLTFDDCVNILYSCANTIHDMILDYLFTIIGQTPVKILACHTTFFSHLIYDGTDKLLELIYNLISKSELLTCHMYWLLTNGEQNANVIKYFELFDPDVLERLSHDYMFYSGLIANLDSPVEYLSKTFDRMQPIRLPYNPECSLIGVDLQNISTKKSNTKPVLIPFDTTHGKKTFTFQERVCNE